MIVLYENVETKVSLSHSWLGQSKLDTTFTEGIQGQMKKSAHFFLYKLEKKSFFTIIDEWMKMKMNGS